jgi:MarC family integral membrane protein
MLAGLTATEAADRVPGDPAAQLGGRRGTPLLAGPGAITAIMVFMGEASTAAERVGVALGLVGVLVVLWLTLLLTRACGPPARWVACREGPEPALVDDVALVRRLIVQHRLALHRVDRGWRGCHGSSRLPFVPVEAPTVRRCGRFLRVIDRDQGRKGSVVPSQR